MQPALGSIKKIEHEYSLRDELDSSWAVRPLALSDQPRQMTLVLEDPGGETLDRFLPGPMELTGFLRIAVGIATALSRLHEKGLIHKDVKPANILVNLATGQTRLMGFGIASRLPRERQASGPPEFIAGTLPYMAPEQTGRMNRSIDSRSDLYALGVTLYEMVTGTLPFTVSDPMELVHAHIARQPTPPCERLKGLPHAVSAIITKLLAKTAEDRYQTAAGAGSDLRRCLREWETKDRIDDFPLGEDDTPDRLLIPEKLYGRASEIEVLLAAFDRIVAGGRPELVLVSGYSGIGKSSLVNELHKPLVPPRGLFASGKFDQYKSDIPYTTLAQAFQSLIRLLLSKNDKELLKWSDALREALDPNGQLIVDLVPELKLIIGEQPPVPELPPRDAQGRFQLVFCRFISVFTREHPLALFFDDLQWIDAATLDLMHALLTRTDIRNLMLIGAYRDNEVTLTHPLMRRLEAIRQAGAIVQDLVLAPLAREDLRQLVADSLHCESDRAKGLAQVLHDKTAGNPFFAIQFFSALAEENLLTFDHRERQWSLDLDRIQSKGYTDNVVDLMVGKLNRLPVETLGAVKQLACLGNSAGFALPTSVHKDSSEELHRNLQEALRTGLLLYSQGAYRFLHDRVQEAAYSLIPQHLRAAAHLRIGRVLAERTPPEKREETIFEIVNQLNRGSALITSQDEREQLAEFNLIAGKRAKASTAYASALDHLIAGAALLAGDYWERRPELIFALELLRAECEFLTGELAPAEARLNMLSSRAANAIDQATVDCLRIDLYTTLDRRDRSVDVCLAYLRKLGVDWSPHPPEELARREYENTWSLLGSRSIEDFVDLPLVSDALSRATLDVLTKVVPAAQCTDRNLFSLVVCRMVNLSLQHGNTDGSSFAYVLLGMIAGPHFDNYNAGFEFGRLGYALAEKRNLHRYQARTYMAFGSFVMPWTRHVRTGRDLVRRAFDVANRFGDLTFGAYSCNNLITNLLAAGDALAETQVEAEKGLEFARNARFGLVIAIITAQIQLIRTLRGLTPAFGCFDEENFDERRFEHDLAGKADLALAECWYWIRKLQACVLAGDYRSAIDASSKARPLLWTSPSFFETAEYEFYSGICRAALCDCTLPDEQRNNFDALTAHYRQLDVWAGNCPENFENRAALLDAEIARLEGRELDAEHLYEKAIRSADANGFVHNAALANELAARFYALRGFEKIAKGYRQEARDGYLRWGAHGKVKQLDRLYPDLGKEAPARGPVGATVALTEPLMYSHFKTEPSPGPTSTIAASVELLDLATVIKVSQAVSGEMALEKLIERLMRAAIEHAGAERGLLIVSQGDELHTQAVAVTSGEDVSVQLPGGVHTGDTLPESLVRYVMRTRETVLLDDAASQNPFSGDPYIVQRRARSILCLPLINQTRMIGVLYLENNLTPYAFTAGRVTVLKVLASQAAISLENARLYCDVENREDQLRLITDSTPVMICSCLPDGSADFFNRRWLEYLNLPLEEISGWGWTSVIHPEDLKDVVNKWRSSLATGEPLEVEARSRRGDGEYRRLLHRAVPLRNEHGKVVKWFVSSIDVEDRRRAEEAVRRSEAYLAEAQHLSHTGSFGCKPASGEMFWSDETFRIFEYDRTTKPAVDAILRRVHPEDKALVQERIDHAISERKDCDVEYRLLLPDNSIRHVHVVAHVVKDAPGGFEFEGAVMDVTARKLTEIELRRSKAHLADAQRLSRTGSVGMEAATKRIFWSDEAARIYGYPPGTEPTADLILQRSHPDDVGLLKDVLERAAQGGSAFDYEHRLMMPDGSIKHLHNLAHSVKDEAGNEEIVGAIVDITDRKVWEQAIRRSEAYLAQAQRLSHTGSFGWKPGTGEIAWSAETYRIFEYDTAEKPHLDMVFERMHPQDRTLAQQVIEGVSASTDFEDEYRLVMPSGAVKHIHVRGLALPDSSGNLEVVGAVTDITERKTAEDRIRMQEREFRQILDLAPQLVAVYGPNRERFYANGVMLDYLGLSLDEWRERFKFGAALHPDDWERATSEFGRSLSSGAGFELELRLRRRDRSYRWFLARCNPMCDDKEQVMRWYLALTDIDERKRAEEKLQQENVLLREEIDKASMFEEIVGTSTSLKAVLSRIAKVAPTDSTVLIAGETGTGKELVARAIHRRSNRASRAFVSVNCAALPPTLVASELFGHEKGAFTGAIERRLGRFEMADRGTIFLDEVGELLPETQAALLRVLQEREFERVGGMKPVHTNVRVIAATNRDLSAAVANGTFRQDLLFRLNVFPIEVPPLRDRKDDIAMLADYFVQRYAHRAGRNIRSIEQKTLDLLQSYDWPGNIRELQNVIERSIILSSTDVFSVDELWLSRRTPPRAVRVEKSPVLDIERGSEREVIEAALRETRGRVSGPSGAAARLRIPPSTLESRIKALKINKQHFKFG